MTSLISNWQLSYYRFYIIEVLEKYDMYNFKVVVLEMIREYKPSFELHNLRNTTYAWLFHKMHFFKVGIFS